MNEWSESGLRDEMRNGIRKKGGPGFIFDQTWKRKQFLNVWDLTKGLKRFLADEVWTPMLKGLERCLDRLQGFGFTLFVYQPDVGVQEAFWFELISPKV